MEVHNILGKGHNQTNFKLPCRFKT